MTQTEWRRSLKACVWQSCRSRPRFNGATLIVLTDNQPAKPGLQFVNSAKTDSMLTAQISDENAGCMLLKTADQLFFADWPITDFWSFRSDYSLIQTASHTLQMFTTQDFHLRLAASPVLMRYAWHFPHKCVRIQRHQQLSARFHQPAKQ